MWIAGVHSLDFTDRPTVAMYSASMKEKARGAIHEMGVEMIIIKLFACVNHFGYIHAF